MRTRLLVVLLAFSVTAVAAFALPLLTLTARERTQQLSISRTADLDRFAGLAQQDDDEQLVSEVNRYTSLYGEPVVVVNAQRQPVVATGLGVDAADVAPMIDAALRNQPAPALPAVMPWSTSDVLLARPVGIGSRVLGAVVVRASVRAAAGDVARSWALILSGAFAALVGCVLLALVLSRWVLRPLAELSRGLGAVAAGHPHAHVRGRDGPRELRELALSFNRMSDAVSEAAEQQRRLISDASHQLRNPLAALRLRVDSLAPRVVSDGQASYRSAVAEVERLESLLDGLLAMAHAEHTATRLAASPDSATCLAAAVVLDRLDFWSLPAGEAGVSLRPGDLDQSVEVRCPEDDLSQVLDVVLDNAIKYGGSVVTVSCTGGAITVTDNGPGLSDEELPLATTRFWRSRRPDHPRGTGLGLPIAHRLITARGGKFTLESGQSGGLAVTIELPS